MSYYHHDHDREYSYDHQARVREVLARKVARLPYEAIIKLQEVAAALEFGEPLELVVTRLKLAPSNLDRGGVQVQPREGIDYDQIAADKSGTKRMTDGPRA